MPKRDRKGQRGLKKAKNRWEMTKNSVKRPKFFKKDQED